MSDAGHEVELEEIPEGADSATYRLADIVRELSVPFMDHEIQWRVQGGRKIGYITARQSRARMDKVLLPKGWSWYDQQRIVPKGTDGKGGGFEKGITLVDPEGRTYGPRWDAGGFPGMSSAEDDFKGGVSDAFKRSAACWGVGAHLYEEGYFGDDEPGATQGKKVAGPPQAAQRQQAPPPRPSQPPPPRPTSGPPPGANVVEYEGPDGREDASPAPSGVNGDRVIEGGPDLSGEKPGVALFGWLQDKTKAEGKPGGKPHFAYANEALKTLGISGTIAQLGKADALRVLAKARTLWTGASSGKADAPSAAVKAEGANADAEIVVNLLQGPPRYLRSWARKLQEATRWPAVEWIFGPSGWASRTGQRAQADDWDTSTVAQCYHALLIALAQDRPEVIGRARLGAAKARIDQAARDLFNVRMLASPGDAIPMFADAHGSGPRTLGELRSWQDGNALHEYAETAEAVVTAWQIPDSSATDGLPSAPVSQIRDDRVEAETGFDRLRRETAADREAAKGSKAKKRR